jgi:hypothetical protein
MSDYADEAALLAAYNDFTATTEEIAAWNTVNPSSDDDTVETKAGLFGADLTDFNADCVAMADNCTPADYASYTGWAIGVNFAPSEAADGSTSGVHFKGLKQLV